MPTARCLAFCLLALLCLGFARKDYAVTVRFFAEARKLDTERFATPIELRHPPRSAYIEKIPIIHERHIKSVYPFAASDGTRGCAFQLDDSGRLNLSVVSTDRRGSSLVAMVGTKAGAHQVLDMVIDRPVNDGIISIQRGLTDLEIAAIARQWPAMGKRKR